TANDVARINPKTGEVMEFDLGVNGPQGIAVAKNVSTDEAELWVTSEGAVTHFAPGNPSVHETIPVGRINNFDPIVLGPDGNLWVPVIGNVLRFPPDTGTRLGSHVTEIPVMGLSPRDIDVAGPALVIADAAGKRILTATLAKAAQGEFSEFQTGASP